MPSTIDMERHRWIERILSERKFSGVTVRLVQNEYDPLTLISQRPPALMVRWRIRPVTTRLRIWYDDVAPRFAGQLAVIPANTVVQALASSKKEISRAIYLLLEKTWLEETMGDASHILIEKGVVHPDLKSISIENAMRRITREINSKMASSETIIESQIKNIAVELIRYARELDCDDHEACDVSTSPMRKLEQILLSTEDCAPTAEALASQLRVDVRGLDRAVRQARGKTLNSLLAEARILQAQRLLADQEFSLKEIAFKLGFCSPSAFSSAFRSATGETPRDFRASSMV